MLIKQHQNLGKFHNNYKIKKILVLIINILNNFFFQKFMVCNQI